MQIDTVPRFSRHLLPMLHSACKIRFTGLIFAERDKSPVHLFQRGEKLIDLLEWDGYHPQAFDDVLSHRSPEIKLVARIMFSARGMSATKKSRAGSNSQSETGQNTTKLIVLGTNIGSLWYSCWQAIGVL